MMLHVVLHHTLLLDAHPCFATITLTKKSICVFATTEEFNCDVWVRLRPKPDPLLLQCGIARQPPALKRKIIVKIQPSG